MFQATQASHDLHTPPQSHPLPSMLCAAEPARTGDRHVEYSRHFKFLICAPAFDPADLEGQRLQAISEEIERDGYGVMKARKVDDAELVIQTDAAVGCVLLDWGKRGPQGKMAGLVTLIRKRGLDMPIIILVRHHRLEDIPVDVLREADG